MKESIDHFDLNELEITKKNFQDMGIIEKISMVKDGVEAHIFKANFQNINF